MPHHKRRRTKNQRAGCLHCKPHKANGCKRHKRQNVAHADDFDPEDQSGRTLTPHYDLTNDQ